MPPSTQSVPFPEGEIKRLENRTWILNYAAKSGVGAELGVFRGHFSAVLAETLKPAKLYLVDPWTKIGHTFGWGKNSQYTNFDTLTTQQAYDEVAERVAKFRNHIDINIVEDYSVPFLDRTEQQFDWVYLDTSHKYNDTLNELRGIDRRLKPDGVILGDDWHPNPDHMHHGVFRAVRDFVREQPYEIVAAGPAAQWAIRRTQMLHGFKQHALPPWVLMADLDLTPKSDGTTKSVSLRGAVVLAEVSASGL